MPGGSSVRSFCDRPLWESNSCATTILALKRKKKRRCKQKDSTPGSDGSRVDSLETYKNVSEDKESKTPSGSCVTPLNLRSLQKLPKRGEKGEKKAPRPTSERASDMHLHNREFLDQSRTGNPTMSKSRRCRTAALSGRLRPYSWTAHNKVMSQQQQKALAFIYFYI